MKFTAAQVGAANLPGAHVDRAAPGPKNNDQTGVEFGFVEDATVGAVRAFRAVGHTVGNTSPQDVASIDTTGDDLADVHHRPGSPDARRNDKQERGNAMGEVGQEVMREVYDNSRKLLTFTPEAPPDRPRQGFTGADPARPATQRRPVMLRGFDKLIAEHPGAVDKIPQPAPRAATGRVKPAIEHPIPSPGGWFATMRAGIGPTRSSTRVLPTPWADTLVQPAPTSAPLASSKRFRR